MPKSRFFVVSLVLTLVALGCESAADVIAKQRAAVEKTFSQVRALKARMNGMGAASGERRAALSPPLVLEAGNAKVESNAMFMYAEDLAAPGEAQAVHLRTIDSRPLLQCGSLLTKQTYFADSITKPMPSVVSAYLSACARLRYALVIRTTQFMRPELSLETRKFASGRYAGEVFAFDLTSGELVGSYVIAVRNEDRIALADADDIEGHVTRLMANLEAEVFEALRVGARETFPGSLPPKS